MALYFASINSGSNGNCYYVGNDDTAVLIDVGITCKEVEKRMIAMNLNIHKVAAIFISHEHADHIKGVSVLAKKYKIPVYITKKTRRRWIKGIHNLMQDFESNQSIWIGDLEIKSFLKFHDAIDPHSFTVSFQDCTIGIFTDIGKVCKQLQQHFKLCNAVFLEANYDIEMLRNGNYPQYLKDRISGGEGHLSNIEAAELFKNHQNENLKYVLLSHLSKENNTPEKAVSAFLPFATNTEIKVASRFAPSEVYKLENSSNQKSATKKSVLRKIFQTVLFE
ncbi:MAG: hypothetical protein RIQ33_1806 [Bacteroidota bacterium]|jgi:phosphoribosyl 1,2-cyclic phosphodiesterase